MIAYLLIISSVIICLGTDVSAQNTDTLYSLNATIGGGYSLDISELAAPTTGLEINRNQYSVFARLMWQPEHLLSGGIEGGYTVFYSVNAQDRGSAYRSAVPFYLVLSMKILDGLSATTGFGVGIASSTVIGIGETINSSSVSFALMGAIQYLKPISDKFSLGGEARYTSLDLYDDELISLSILITYKLLEY
jgi:hypothetical protein